MMKIGNSIKTMCNSNNILLSKVMIIETWCNK